MPQEVSNSSAAYSSIDQWQTAHLGGQRSSLHDAITKDDDRVRSVTDCRLHCKKSFAVKFKLKWPNQLVRDGDSPDQSGRNKQQADSRRHGRSSLMLV